MAGTDTTSSTLEWAMAELIRNTEYLFKAQAGLEQVIGKGNQVKESDTLQLPYLQAVVKETFRLHPAAPFLLPRKAIEEVNICGYRPRLKPLGKSKQIYDREIFGIKC